MKEKLAFLLIMTMFYPMGALAEVGWNVTTGAQVIFGSDTDENGSPLSVTIVLNSQTSPSEGSYLAYAKGGFALIGGFSIFNNNISNSFICFLFESENPVLYREFVGQILQYGSDEYSESTLQLSVTRDDNPSSTCSSVIVLKS